MSATDSASAPEASQIIRPSKFHHVGIKTGRLDEMIAFYKQVLGVREVAVFPFAVFMAYDEADANHRVVFFTVPQAEGTPDPNGTGLHHLAYEYDDIDALLENYQTLKAAGLEPVWVTNHGPTTSFYYSDPDGNQIELQVDNFGGTEGSIAFMRSDEYLSNPLGADIDPELLIAARRAGASLKDLHKRSYSGEFVPEGGPTGPGGVNVG